MYCLRSFFKVILLYGREVFLTVFFDSDLKNLKIVKIEILSGKFYLKKKIFIYFNKMNRDVLKNLYRRIII